MPVSRLAQRSFLALTAALTGALALAQTDARLPQRNLLVELRQTDGSSTDASGAGVRSGSVTIGSNGEVRSRAEVGIASTSRSAGSDAQTSLRVLNGGQGFISTGYSVPVTWYSQAWSSPSGGSAGQGVTGTTALVDVGRRVAVRPRWPGGTAPVTVEIRTEASAMAAGGMPSRFGLDGRPLPEGATEAAGLLTTLALPLGEWVTVAGTEQAGQRSESGTVYRSESRTQTGSRLQMRVTAP